MKYITILFLLVVMFSLSVRAEHPCDRSEAECKRWAEELQELLDKANESESETERKRKAEIQRKYREKQNRELQNAIRDAERGYQGPLNHSPAECEKIIREAKRDYWLYRDCRFPSERIEMDRAWNKVSFTNVCNRKEIMDMALWEKARRIHYLQISETVHLNPETEGKETQIICTHFRSTWAQ